MSYLDLFAEFLERKITILEFEERFSDKFKNQKEFSSGIEFNALDELLGDLDCYHPANGLFFDPVEDLTEDQIRELVEKTVYTLQHL